MSDHEDLELDALQRKLDDAFETTRPRRGFEDELWLRMQQRRPFGTRVTDALSGLFAGFREAPAIPVAATALVVIVAIGVGVLSSGISPLGKRESASTAAGPVAADQGHGGYASGQRVPTPAFHPELTSAPGPQTPFGVPQMAPAPSDLYFGPANLTWSGSFTSEVPAAPVLVYTEPTDAQRRAGVNASAGVAVTTSGTVAQLPLEPTVVLTESSAGVPAGTDPVQAANSFLAANNLTPPWPNNVVAVQSGGVTRVVFQRAFALPGGDSAYLVNWVGERYGIEVQIVGGRRTAIGPIQLSYQSVSYPLISNTQAAQLAVAEPPAGTQSILPVPTVTLDHVELVYALAVSGGSGFYEPAYLFSGTFQYNGLTYTKRVLVPLVDPSQRS